MMLSHRRGGYLSSAGTLVSRPKRSILSVFICFFLAFAFIATTVGDSFLAHNFKQNVAQADPGDDEETMNEAAGDVQKDQTGFEKTFDDAFANEPERNSFEYVIRRLFTINYMNSTEDGVAADPFPEKDWQCDAKDPFAGTPIYHNCDVPNIVTEFMQTITALLIPTGPQNAEAGQAKAFMGLGLPSTIPGNGTVPTEPNDRSVKYTALELFGYNLKYTSYRGEWDHIKVMTEARTLSNFGVMDSLRLGVATVVNGIVGGVSEGTSRFLDGLSRGDLLGAIGGFFAGLFEGGSSAAVNTILDTSDMNVFNTYAWYRVDYGSTLYRARELNQTEIAANIQAKLEAMLEGRPLTKADLPEDFVSIQNGPPEPKEAISKCTATKTDGTKVDIKDPANPPGGISEGDCKAAAASDYQDDNPTWSKDSTQKAELIKDWKVTNSSVFATATKYKIECTISDDEDGRTTNLSKFYECWTSAWNAVKDDVRVKEQDTTNQEWLNNQFAQSALVEFFSKPENNFNAPWNRFVCTDAKGKDIMDGLQPRMLFLTNGQYNPSCEKVRPPIQNGYYGNGYTHDTPNGQPAIDTRWSALAHYSIFDIFFKPFAVWGDASGIANMGLSIATFFTQFSNAILDLAFSPILEKLGLDTKIVSLIIAFRDSVYFPFISLLIAMAGLTILFQAGRRRAYAAAFKDLALVVGTFMLGVIILFNPQGLLKAVDQFPAEVEAGIIGTIFNVGLEEDDGVCSAQQTAGGGGGTDLSGNPLNFSPRASIRTMECEVWRAFAFNPWVMGQWGTTYDQLYANGNAPAGAGSLQNSNGSLVGTAAVNMGGGKVLHNWALYQLDATTIGTATTEDLRERSGGVSRDFYRIVDAQAGPNNGAASDGRYLASWSGQNSGVRTGIGVMSGFVAFIGFITIAAYSIVKIEITLLTAIMLLFLPIFLLLGVHPTFGRVKLKQYTGTIVALMIQRLVLITLLAVMLKLLTAITLSTQNYMLGGLLAAGTCAAFLSYRKEIFALITNSIANKSGGLFAQDAVDNPRGKFQQMLPLSVRNYLGSTTTGLKSAAGGFVGGYVAGGISGGIKSANQASMLGRHRLRNQQRRTGVGGFTKFSEAQRAGERVGNEATATRDQKAGVLREEAVIKSLNKHFTERRTQDFREQGLPAPTDDQGGTEWMEWDPKAKMNQRDLSELVPIMSRISQLEKQNQEGAVPGYKKKPGDTNIDLLKARKAARDEREVEIRELRGQADVLTNRLYQKNAKHLDYDFYQEAAAERAAEAQANGTENPERRTTGESRAEVLAGMSNVERLSYQTARMKERVAETATRLETKAQDFQQARYDSARSREDALRAKIAETRKKVVDKAYRKVKRGDED